MLGTIMFGTIFLINMPFLRRRRIGLPLLLLLAFLAAEIGSGGGSSTTTIPPPVNKSTPAGNYTIQITAADGVSSVSTTVTAAVQ